MLCFDLAFKLHVDIEVVLDWSMVKISNWLAYFAIKSQWEREAFDAAQQAAKTKT